MTYKETCDFLFSRLPMYQRVGKAAYKANLNTTIAIDNYFNNPHKRFKSVHIAGTNGKGSTAHMLAAILQQSGYKTGLYTSPHLLDFRERIKINGTPIPENKVIEFVDSHYANIQHFEPSFFELTVAMAFDFFADEMVDIAIIETGMGGRLDSTNIINPILSVITNITFDHTQFLGDSLLKIAAEKAGIIKENTPIIIGEYQSEIEHIFKEYSAKLNAPIYFADKEIMVEYSSNKVEEKQVFQAFKDNKLIYDDLKLDLLGLYQQKNLATVLKVVELLQNMGIQISEENIYEALQKTSTLTGLLGRWQTTYYMPKIVCDTGHNEAGIENILNQLKNSTYNRLHIVFGVVNDKNIDNVLKMLPTDATYYFCKASIPRALSELELLDKAKQIGLTGMAHSDVVSAIDAATGNAENSDMIFVGGSTFIVADYLAYLQTNRTSIK